MYYLRLCYVQRDVPKYFNFIIRPSLRSQWSSLLTKHSNITYLRGNKAYFILDVFSLKDYNGIFIQARDTIKCVIVDIYRLPTTERFGSARAK